MIDRLEGGLEHDSNIPIFKKHKPKITNAPKNLAGYITLFPASPDPKPGCRAGT